MLNSELLDSLAVSSPVATGPVSFGLVTACDNGLVEASGLSVPVGCQCRIEQLNHGIAAEVIGFRNGHTILMLLGDSVLLSPGARVYPEGRPGMLPVGESFLGRAVDGEGRPIDGLGDLSPSTYWPATGVRTGALDRSSVTVPFDSGVRSINALVTMGQGQRIGVMAGSGVGKSVLIDMIAKGSAADVVIFGLIGERAREVTGFVERHMKGDLRSRTITVAVPADHSPTLRIRGAHLAISLAEYFRAQGKQVLLVMDSLTRVAHAAREIGFLMGEPGAARGYPPSALASITKIVERAGNSASSGGSVTGLFTVLADGDDENDPVVDTARSILDGHIVLSRALAQRGQYPAIDIGASLSRVMSEVAAKEHKLSASRLRALCASYEANHDLVLMGAYRAGADAQLDKAIAMHPAISAFLTQEAEASVSLEESILELHRLVEGPVAN